MSIMDLLYIRYEILGGDSSGTVVMEIIHPYGPTNLNSYVNHKQLMMEFSLFHKANFCMHLSTTLLQ